MNVTPPTPPGKKEKLDHQSRSAFNALHFLRSAHSSLSSLSLSLVEQKLISHQTEVKQLASNSMQAINLTDNPTGF